jgi:putative ABC transport system substrate-binding protein
MRRAILGLSITLGVLLGASLPLESAEVPRVVAVFFTGTSRYVPHFAAFLDTLRDQGYVEGQNVRIEFRSAMGNVDRLAPIADELVALNPDVILSSNNNSTFPLRERTQTIPIVMALANDPMKWGFIESLSHPGGNITGLAEIDTTGLIPKQMQLLKELVPQAKEILIIWNPMLDPSVFDFEEAERTAPSLSVKLRSVPIRDLGELRNSLQTLDTSINDGTPRAMLVDTNPPFFTNRSLIIDFSIRHRLPTMHLYREEVADGGLIAFGGMDLTTQFRRAATYVAKILKGAKPADLPVEQPTRFHLVVNLKTAQALDLAIPPSILVRADEVIE